MNDIWRNADERVLSNILVLHSVLVLSVEIWLLETFKEYVADNIGFAEFFDEL